MTKPSNIESIEAATNIPWQEWLSYFESINGKELSHTELAQKAHDKLDSNQASPGWWAQGVAVAYEQHIGRRQPGQKSDGTFEVAASKTLPGTMDDALELWTKTVNGKTEFFSVAITDSPNTSKTEKWRHWRCGLADGSRISVDTYNKTHDKTILTITHSKLQDNESAEKWRLFWKDILKSL